MPLLSLILGSLVLLVLAYRIYGSFLTRQFEIEDANPVPSETMRDGIDFVPTNPFVVMGHHFSSIAGAGPIVGPVLAGLYFGWAPALAWILLGSIFIGGVHDFGSLLASVRHKAGSVADVARIYMGPWAGRLFLLFIWLALIYVVVVFLDLTAGTFAKEGTVATSSLLFIGLAIALGLTMRRGGLPMGKTLLIFLPLLFCAVWAGEAFPLTASPQLFGSSKYFWSAVLLGYCFVASVIPVWILLQPRDFLSSFLLYGAIFGAVVGLVIGALGPGSLALTWKPFVSAEEIESFGKAPIGLLFPFLFITIACGACSGFHSLVSSGTTARQVKTERHAFRVGYGAMLIEGFVAVIALMTVCVMVFEGASFGNPLAVFSSGVGKFLGALGIPHSVGANFAALAVSTFLLTTLDTCTRLTRYIVQDVLRLPNGKAGSRYLATAIALVIPATLAFMEFTDGKGNPIPLWKAIWPIFGASNQLLAGLALLTITVWMKRVGRRYVFVGLPMVLMLSVTMVALCKMVIANSWLSNDSAAPFTMIGWISAALFLMGLVIAGLAVRAFRLEPLNQEAVALGAGMNQGA